jgi:hypothetical protein
MMLALGDPVEDEVPKHVEYCANCQKRAHSIRWFLASLRDYWTSKEQATQPTDPSP